MVSASATPLFNAVIPVRGAPAAAYLTLTNLNGGAGVTVPGNNCFIELSVLGPGVTTPHPTVGGALVAVNQNAMPVGATADAWGRDRNNDGALAGEATVESAAAWSPIGAKGFLYKDTGLAQDGTLKLLLKAGAPGSEAPTKVIWIGKGALLPDPTVPVTEPVNVTVQVVGSNGFCIADTFTGAIKNESNGAGTLRTFKAKKP